MKDTIKMRLGTFKANERLYVIHKIVFSTALLISSGTIAQAFLLAIGISSGKTSAYAAWIQIAQVLTMVSISFFCDKVRHIKQLLTFVIGIMPAGALACILGGNFFTAYPRGLYGIVLAGGILLNFALGIYNIFIYKLPYLVFELSEFGRLNSIANVLSGLLGVETMLSVSLCTKHFDFLVTMTVFFPSTSCYGFSP